jgi:hypothetical protein
MKLVEKPSSIADAEGIEGEDYAAWKAGFPTVWTRRFDESRPLGGSRRPARPAGRGAGTLRVLSWS